MTKNVYIPLLSSLSLPLSSSSLLLSSLSLVPSLVPADERSVIVRVWLLEVTEWDSSKHCHWVGVGLRWIGPLCTFFLL